MEIYIPDPSLHKCIDQAVNRSSFVTRELDQRSLSTIRYLNANSWEIKDLTGLENCEKLESLFLSGNQMSNLELLINLKSLRHLDLSNNPQLDWSTLTAPLLSVKELGLHSCQLKTDEVLSFFPNVVQVSLFHNRIFHINKLYDLPMLEAVDLSQNFILAEEIESFYNQTGVGTMKVESD